jgi:membrane fusion protein (multidrug efflux system)
MNKRFRIITTSLLIILLTLIIFWRKIEPLFGSKNQDTVAGVGGGGLRGPGGAARQLLNVEGFVINATQMSELISNTGTLKPDEEVELSFETSGKIVEINFTEGTRVKEGQLLAKINDKPLQAQLQKLQAQKKLTVEKEFRQRSLLDKDAISKESYDQIVTELETLEADLNLIKARISETELRAPFDGIIGLRYLSEGSYANTSTRIARLVKISPLKVEFSISERYADQVKIGYPVTFKIVGSPENYEAEVYAVDPKVDLTTRTIIIRALYPNKREELKSGRFTTITLLLSQIDNAIAIPTEALIPEMEGEIVFIYKSGKAERVKVTTGLRTASEIQIVSGLNFGDTLITSGILQLRQSLPVVLDTVINKSNLLKIKT